MDSSLPEQGGSFPGKRGRKKTSDTDEAGNNPKKQRGDGESSLEGESAGRVKGILNKIDDDFKKLTEEEAKKVLKILRLRTKVKIKCKCLIICILFTCKCLIISFCFEI